jgi:hypothetical protein
MKNILKPALALSAFFLAAFPAHAFVTFSQVGGDEIFTDGTGLTDAPAGSLVLFVADTNDNGFGNLAPGAITVGSAISAGSDDIIEARFTMTLTGLLDASSGSLTLSGAWNAGDPVAVYWIPSLTSTDTNVGAGVSYGMYTDPTGVGGSAAWITPTDGTTTTTAMFFQSNNDGFFAPSPNVPSNTGFAGLVTVPEPSTFALLGGIVALGLVARRRKTATVA